MFFNKVKNDGSVALKYKRGKCSKKEYKSKCLGYKFRIPDGFCLYSEEQLKEKSKPKDIIDFKGTLSSGIEVGVNFIPSEGEFPVTNDNIRDILGEGTVKRMNDISTDGRTSTYYGLAEFCGKQCAHSITKYKKEGLEFWAEFYQYYTTYYMLQFAFIYNDSNRFGLGEAKALFSAL